VGQEVAGRYRIVAKLGEGGMGAVYRAEQISLKRRVALKVLKPELSSKPGLVRRFNAEAELAAKLNHPNTVTLYDFGQDQEGALFIAMEFIEGRSLREILVREGPQAIDRIVAIGAQICSSLSDAHTTGIVHRDLKPDNVMLSDRGKKRDVVTVLDFGIAKLRDQEGNITQQPMTRAGDMLGTPQYMAPEQIRGDKVDARTDVYAMGVILYEMVTARLPFEAPSVMALLSKHLTEAPIPPHQRRTDLTVDPRLEGLIMSCLAKAPEQRPPTMDAVEEALTMLAPTKVPGSVTPPVTGQTIPNRGQSPYPGPAAYPSPPGGGPPSGHMPPSGYGSPPPGYKSPPPGVPHSFATPAQHPVPVATAVVPPRRSRSWLLPLLALVVLGGGGAGAYFAFVAPGADSEEEEEGDGSDFMSKWAGDSPPADHQDQPSPPSDTKDDVVAAESVVYSGSSYRDAMFSYGFDLPEGFVGGGDGLGSATHTGKVGGHEQTIITTAWSESGSFDQSDIEEALDLRLSLLGLNAESMSWRRVRGRPVLFGQVNDPETGQEGDFVLMRRAPEFYFVIIGGPPESYNATRKFRRNFIEEHIRLDVK
jgi:serine/threonine-protein kinase